MAFGSDAGEADTTVACFQRGITGTQLPSIGDMALYLPSEQNKVLWSLDLDHKSPSFREWLSGQVKI